MSDDRLYLRCKVCGAALKLASIYYADVADKIPGPEAIKAFLDEHLDRCKAWDWERAGKVGFEIE